MKHIFCLFVFVGLASNTSYAQIPPPAVYQLEQPVPGGDTVVSLLASGNISVRANGVPAHTIVHRLGVALGYEVWGERPPHPLSVTIVDVQPNAALSMILNKIGYRYDKNDTTKTITVFEQGQQWQHSTPFRTATLASPGPASPAPNLKYSYSAAVLPDNYSGGPTWMDYRMEEARVAAEATAAYNLAMHHSRMAQAANVYLMPPTLYPSHSTWFGMKGCMTGPSGKIKFKYVGRDEERVLWEVEFNGDIIGSIDQADSFFNGTWFCVGSHVVKAVKRGAGEVERRYSVRPGELTEITIGDFLLKK